MGAPDLHLDCRGPGSGCCGPGSEHPGAVRSGLDRRACWDASTGGVCAGPGATGLRWAPAVVLRGLPRPHGVPLGLVKAETRVSLKRDGLIGLWGPSCGRPHVWPGERPGLWGSGLRAASLPRQPAPPLRCAGTCSLSHAVTQNPLEAEHSRSISHTSDSRRNPTPRGGRSRAPGCAVCSPPARSCAEGTARSSVSASGASGSPPPVPGQGVRPLPQPACALAPLSGLPLWLWRACRSGTMSNRFLFP